MTSPAPPVPDTELTDEQQRENAAARLTMDYPVDVEFPDEEDDDGGLAATGQ